MKRDFAVNHATLARGARLFGLRLDFDENWKGGSEMTPQEQEMIGDLIDRVQKTQLAEKDVDAEQMLEEGMGRNPDALYILAQTVLVQKYALEQAQAQLAQARSQLQQRPEPKHASSFLGSLLGRNDAPPPPPPTQAYPPPAYPPYAAVGGYPPYGAPMGLGAGGGGFLRGAMQTAAGVAAGALAFEGIESLMHGFGHAAGYGPGFGGFDGGQRPTEEIVNNYYGDDRGEHGGHEFSGSDRVEGRRDDFGGREDRDSAYDRGDSRGDDRRDDLNAASLDGSSSFDNDAGNLEDASLDDGGGDFGDGGSGGGDDGSFA